MLEQVSEEFLEEYASFHKNVVYVDFAELSFVLMFKERQLCLVRVTFHEITSYFIGFHKLIYMSIFK